MFGQTVASSLTGTKPVPVKKDPQSSTTDNRYRPGIVTIIDVFHVKESQVCHYILNRFLIEMYTLEMIEILSKIYKNKQIYCICCSVTVSVDKENWFLCILSCCNLA